MSWHLKTFNSLNCWECFESQQSQHSQPSQLLRMFSSAKTYVVYIRHGTDIIGVHESWNRHNWCTWVISRYVFCMSDVHKISNMGFILCSETRFVYVDMKQIEIQNTNRADLWKFCFQWAVCVTCTQAAKKNNLEDQISNYFGYITSI